MPNLNTPWECCSISIALYSACSAKELVMSLILSFIFSILFPLPSLANFSNSRLIIMTYISDIALNVNLDFIFYPLIYGASSDYTVSPNGVVGSSPSISALWVNILLLMWAIVCDNS